MIRLRWARGVGATIGGIAALAWPSRADAHLVQTGFGAFYDGISHLALTPEDLLPTIALGLLAGLRGRRFGRRALLMLPALWLAGGLLGLFVPGVTPESLVTVGSFLVLGGLVAADAKLPVPLFTALAALVGLIHGSLNGAAMAQAGLGSLGLLGIASAVFVLVTLTSAFVVSRRTPWARIAVRVVGSWVVATGMLMIGWSLRGGS
jgi:hydrogenase/urease accessory protein HupE